MSSSLRETQSLPDLVLLGRENEADFLQAADRGVESHVTNEGETPMSKPLIEVMLPRLAGPLFRDLEKFQSGELNEQQFTSRFEGELNRQHAWLSKKGISAGRAAVAIHAAVLVLSLPGLRAEAVEAKVPLEVLEMRAIREAAQDVSATYGLPVMKSTDAISVLFAKYAG